MILSQILEFNNIDFDNLNIPVFVVETESSYNEDLQKSNYVLEQDQYDQYTSRWARVYDWYGLQFSRATYFKKKIEEQLSEVLMNESANIPENVKTKAAKEAWINQNSKEYHEINKLYAKACAFYVYFEHKKEATKIKHYNCKSMSSSIDIDKPIGGFQSS